MSPCVVVPKSLIITFLFALVIVIPPALYADTLLLHPKHSSAAKIAKELSQSIPESHISTEYSSGKYSLVITIGSEQYLKYRFQIKEPILAAYIYYNVFEPRDNHYALLLEPDPQALAKHIKKQFGDDPIGYIYTDKQDSYLKALNKELNVKSYKFDESLANTFRWIKHDAAIAGFYISENRKIFINEHAIRETLRQLLDQRIPAITSNEILKKSGPVLSIYSPRRKINKELTVLAKRLIAKETPPNLNFVPLEKEFNKTAARSLNITIKEEVAN